MTTKDLERRAEQGEASAQFVHRRGCSQNHTMRWRKRAQNSMELSPRNTCAKNVEIFHLISIGYAYFTSLNLSHHIRKPNCDRIALLRLWQPPGH